MVPIQRAIRDADYEKVVGVMGSQMGKTDAMLNVIGHRLDDDPVPIMYVAPTKSFIESVFEPRYNDMVRGCESLLAKKPKVKREPKTKKVISGVKVRFAWAGSPTEMAGDPACKVFVDERDRMDDNVGGEGDPVTLADARHDTYPDGQTIVFSTPTMGNVDTVLDEHGLEFWDFGDEVESATWRLFQEGTRYHWAVPCPDCDDFFIPRFKYLTWPDKATPNEARERCGLACPNCGSVIPPSERDDMNKRGVYVAPGQTIDQEGNVFGDPPASAVASFWVSGLMSPWKDWGSQVEKFLKAARTGDSEAMQAVLNTGFGELFSVAGDAPAVNVVQSRRLPYKSGEVSADVVKVLMTVDVQQDRLVYSIRGWGRDLESWLIHHGELMGATDEDAVWRDLASFKDRVFGNVTIDRLFIDSGYRTQFVYKFCRAHRTWAHPTKGRDTLDSAPLTKSKLDVTSTGKRKRGGLGVWFINTDYFKRWVHERIERDPDLPGGWHLPEDATDDYCKQVVAEARVVKASGRVTWVKTYKDNHYFDCEVLQVACAYSLNLQTLTTDQDPKSEEKVRDQVSTAPAARKPEHGRDPFRHDDRDSRTRGGGGWFGRRN